MYNNQKPRRFSDNTEKTYYPATCGTCGNECQVPFQPTGEKPVLCSDCFKKSAPRRDDRFSRSAPRSGRDNARAPMRRREDSASKSDTSKLVMFHIDKMKKDIENLDSKINLLLEAQGIDLPKPAVDTKGLKEALEKIHDNVSEELSETPEIEAVEKTEE